MSLPAVSDAIEMHVPFVHRKFKQFNHGEGRLQGTSVYTARDVGQQSGCWRLCGNGPKDGTLRYFSLATAEGK